MNELYPIPKRQRKPGAFPMADAMRAEKAASVTSVALAPTLPAEVLPFADLVPTALNLPNSHRWGFI